MFSRQSVKINKHKKKGKDEEMMAVVICWLDQAREWVEEEGSGVGGYLK